MARYCQEIVKELIELDNENEYVLIIDKTPKENLINNGNFRYVQISNSNFIIGEQISIPQILFKEKFDVFWSPNNTFPVFKPKTTKLLVTVHDVIFLYSIDKSISFYQRIGALYRRYILKGFFKKVNCFFTVSYFSKSELLRLLPIKVPIDITYNCIDKFASKVEAIKRQEPQLKSENYFFTVSGDGPNKNLNTLLSVFETYFPSENLIIGGVSSESKYRKRERANIHFLPYGITDEELIKAYLKCKCFLFFSKYEGFGIPLIEAAICGKPILASNTTSIPEIIGDFGNMTDPTYIGIKNLISEYITTPTKSRTDYSSLIKRFNNWKIPAEIILKRITKQYNDKI